MMKSTILLVLVCLLLVIISVQANDSVSVSVNVNVDKPNHSRLRGNKAEEHVQMVESGAELNAAGCASGSQTNIKVQITTWSGGRGTKSLTINRKVAREVQAIFQQIAASGFRIKDVGGYSCRGNTSNRAKLSNHAYGVAIDINSNENPYVRGSQVVGSRAFINRASVAGRPGVITANGPVVRAFKAKGWSWGGEWRSVKDYMHFEKPSAK